MLFFKKIFELFASGQCLERDILTDRNKCVWSEVFFTYCIDKCTDGWITPGKLLDYKRRKECQIIREGKSTRLLEKERVPDYERRRDYQIVRQGKVDRLLEMERLPDC